MNTLPDNLTTLHLGEEQLRVKSIAAIEENTDLQLHLRIAELTMDLADVFRQLQTEDEDIKVLQMLGMRLFNAFAASVKLALSGYYQNSALIMRDILETVFLLDFFRTNPEAITKWRTTDSKQRWNKFKPSKIRSALDKRDGLTTGKRAEIYSLFSDLAGHPSMSAVAMLKPKGMDARNGPFVDPTALAAVISEMGRLAIQAGEILRSFIPEKWANGLAIRQTFLESKSKWIAKYYPKQ